MRLSPLCREILVVCLAAMLAQPVLASGSAAFPRRDVKHSVEWWTRTTAPNVALFDSLDRIAWPAGETCYNSSVVADSAWKKHYGVRPRKLERHMFRFGPTIRRWQQQWIVLYGGAPSGPGIQVMIGAATGKVDSVKAGLSMK